MPVESKAQNAAMHAAAVGKSNLGIPAKVGREFTENQPKGSVKRLPMRVRNAHKTGMISERARTRKLMKYGDLGANDVDAATA